MLKVYRNPRKLDLPIEGVSMTSHPDLSLRLGTIGNDTLKKDPEIELVVEVRAGNIDRRPNYTLTLLLV